MTDGVLVVGYGNGLRSDDGIGRLVAERLADDPRLAGVTVLSLHQLVPELAVDISRASLVVLIDAAHGLPPGSFTIERVGAAAQPAATWSHQLGPASLVALANELYGQSAEVALVSVGVESVDVGDRLSPVVAAAMPRVIQAVADLVAGRVAPVAAVSAGGHGRA